MAMGRPKKTIDWDLLDKILQYKVSLIDAAEMMGVSDDTLNIKIKKKHKCTFSEYRNKKMARTRLGLQQKAITMAMAGNNTMMIFCLKNLCKWSDQYDADDDEYEVADD